jgi:MGT family glycosyltransferase
MARAVVFTYPDPSHVLSALPVFAELARRGEQVTIYSTATYRDAIESSGATYSCYSGTMDASSNGPFGGMWRRIAFAEQVLPELLETLRAQRPDYVILDAAANWGSVVAGVLRIPAVSYRLTFALHRDMLDAAEMVRRFYGQASQEFVLQGMLDLAGYYETAHRVDRQYGSRTADVASSLECRCDLNLVLIARALQIEPERFDQSYRFVGRCLGESLEQDSSSWDELGADPLIYISLGTVFNNRPEFFRACLEAFGGLPLRVAMSAGRRVDLAALGPVPPNFLLAAYLPVPIAKLLARCTLAITHAGAGTLEECARAGLPQLMYPQAGDQFILADRVQQLGAGLRLSDADIAGGRLRELASRVMDDPSYRRAARALSESVRETGGTAQACDEIQAFARRIADQESASTRREKS